MLDESKNPIPTENSSPISPPAVAESYDEAKQEPTTPALENTTDLGDSHLSVPVERSAMRKNRPFN